MICYLKLFYKNNQKILLFVKLDFVVNKLTGRSHKLGVECQLVHLGQIGVNPFDCTKCDRIFDRIIAPEGEKGSCHAIQKLHI